MIERLLSKLIEKLQNTKAGYLFAFVFFVIAVLICIFGLWKTIFITIFTLVGFIVGAFFFGDESKFKQFMDRILPPGRVR